MKFSDNYGFSLPNKADRDSADIDVISENFKEIDKLLAETNSVDLMPENTIVFDTPVTEIPKGITKNAISININGKAKRGVLISLRVSGLFTEIRQIFIDSYGYIEERKSMSQSGGYTWSQWDSYLTKTEIQSLINERNDYVLTEEDKAKITAQVQTVCVAKNQGSANVGKILVVGTDGNLTLADMPEGGASGDVVGVLDEANNILLSGNLADGTYILKWLNTDGTYLDAGSLVVDTIKKYTITQNLTNVTSDNSATSVITGGSFTTNLTANDGYSISSITVTMGGTDITSSAVNGNVISIASVTGDIVITSVASEPNYTNLATSFQEGYRFNSSGTTTAQDGATACLNYIPFTKATVVRVKGFGDLTFTNSAVYSSSKSVLNCTKVTSMTSALTYSYDSANEIVTLTCVHNETAFIRIAGKLTGTTNDVIITVNEDIV